MTSTVATNRTLARPAASRLELIEAAPRVPLTSVGAVVLTTGHRPEPLRRAVASLLAQRGVDLTVTVVGNGCVPDGLPSSVRVVPLPQNVGVPEGRNVGARNVAGELLLFLDDDAELPETDIVARLAGVLRSHPGTATVQPRAVDPSGRPSPRRWVPRLRVGDPTRAGVVAGLWEGVFAVRRDAFEQAGGWPGGFFYAHEGIELTWRLFDAGWVCRYEPHIEVHHPATSPTRHPQFYRLNARNRVWVARRNLPAMLVPLYLSVWVALTIARVRDPRALLVWCKGFGEGLATDSGPRSVIRWRTVARLTAAGRPPIV